jgi:hypothetical protein
MSRAGGVFGGSEHWHDAVLLLCGTPLLRSLRPVLLFAKFAEVQRRHGLVSLWSFDSAGYRSARTYRNQNCTLIYHN